MMKRCASLLIGFLLLSAPSATRAQASNPVQFAEFFETKIRPVLAEHCFSCHGPRKQQAGMRLDSKAALLKGTTDGPVVVPGHPEKSALITALRHDGEVRMPPDKKLSTQVVADFAHWIKLGAHWPDAKITADPKSTTDAWKKHWAFQPIRAPKMPDVKGAERVSNPIDAFILAKLEEKGLTLSSKADPRTLLRRLKFDLLGLPPTLDEVEAFEKAINRDPQTALEELVDRCLASPQYGERWARHWLDVARYADSKGYVFLEERRYAYAYTYRDYVVKAFNDDLPFDQFILHQLAADRLVATGKAPVEAQAAMGYLTLGRRFLNNIHDIIDDRIDVTARGLLGLTVTCARCHDHKYDPIPTEDYYSLHGVFASSIEPKELPLIGQPERTEEYLAFEKKLGELQGAVVKYKEENKDELAKKNRKHRDELKALEKKVDAFKASSPVAPPRAMILADAPGPVQAQVFVRGNPNNRGKTVPRQFLGALSAEKRQPFKDGSGRLELARAIASKDNPLTARVLVNRVWLHHFGTGLVTTPSDFGLRSDAPSHPELLDYLAWRFMDEGWSLKKLHRLIVLSSAYQQASVDSAAARQVDPDNRLLWRFNRQRLEFEAMRDALLAVSGKLDLKIGGPAVDIAKAPFSARRTLYGFIDRQNLPGMFRTFDFASPDATSPQRYFTTVPQQALYLLNSPFVQEQARALVKRMDTSEPPDDAARIRRLHQLAYARQPDEQELDLGVRFVQEAGAEGGLTAWERYAQVLLLANEFVFVD